MSKITCMKKFFVLLPLLAATVFTACKKDDNKPADPASYQLLGTWEDVASYSLTMTGAPAHDRYTFKAENAYSKFYLGDIGESGKFEIVLTQDPAVLNVRLNREGTQPSDTLTIQWVDSNLIKISDNTRSERQFKRI